ncbi:hypothetical protein EYF80_043292 [Liparis tanakae]|uniref:Uncharacterized protein n=1 Tax=Liparis tanakae TaxID=230148 RepID=A0A4Z2G0W9_9TELE|nr:hypothetical protein EYF80_043292 [Liparis tanakae]
MRSRRRSRLHGEEGGRREAVLPPLLAVFNVCRVASRSDAGENGTEPAVTFEFTPALLLTAV